MEANKGKNKIIKKEVIDSESDDEEFVYRQFIQAEDDNNNNNSNSKRNKGVLKKGSGGGCGGGGSGGLRSCQVEKCMTDLSGAKQYHKRHKVCEIHAKAQVVIVSGIRQRFCQQCSRFHELSEFDDTKRSCRRRLAGHNERRRKNAADSLAEGSSRKAIESQLREMVCGQVDDNGRIKIAIQENSTTYKHFQIR